MAPGSGPTVLAQLAGHHARPEPLAARHQREVAQERGHQRGLAAAVGPGERHPVAPDDLEVQRPHPEQAPFDHRPGEPGHHRTGPGRLLDGEAQVPALPGLGHHLQRLTGPVGLTGLGRQLFGAVDPEVPLRLVVVPGLPALAADPGRGPPALPLGPALELSALTLVELVGLGGVAPHVGPLGLVPVPAASVLVPRAGVLVELEDGADRPSKEVPVVGDDDQSAPERPDPALEPGQALEVEIVGRLVQQGQVEVRELGAGQGHLGPLPARERRNRLVGQCRTESDLLEHRVDTGVEVAHAQPGEALEGHLVAPLGRRSSRCQPGCGLGQFRLGRTGPGPSAQVLPDGLTRRRLVLLGQVADRGRGRVPDDLPGVGLDQARQELEQRRLADSVGSDHPHTGVGADGDRGPVDDRAAAPVMGEVARHQRGRWGWAATGWSMVRGQRRDLSGRWTGADTGSPVLSACRQGSASSATGGARPARRGWTS